MTSSLKIALITLTLLIPRVGKTDPCLDTLQNTSDPTLTCAELTYFVGTTDGFSNYTDSLKGLFESRYDNDDNDIFFPDPQPDNLSFPFFSTVETNTFEDNGGFVKFEIQHRGSVAFTARDAITQGAIFGSDARLNITPRTTDESGEKIDMVLTFILNVRLEDPVDNATEGRAVAGAGFSIYDEDPTAPIVERSGAAVFDTAIDERPSFVDIFATDATFSLANEAEDQVDISVDFIVNFQADPDQPLTLETNHFGSIFSDGFEAGDTSAWASISENSFEITLSSVDPRVTFDLNTESEAFNINPGLNGAWFNASTPGQGFFLDVFPDIPLMFLSWFTWDTTQSTSSQPESPLAAVSNSKGFLNAVVGDDDHRWLTAQGAFTGGTANLNVNLTQGGLFDDPTPTTNTPEGTMTVTFTDCSNGVIDYNFTAAGVSGSVPIVRIANDNVALCESLNQ